MQTTSMKRPDGVKNFPTPAPPVTDERLNDFKSVVTRNMVGVVACRHFRGRKLRQHDGCVRFRPRTRHPLPPVTIVQHPPITGPEAGNLPATCPSPSGTGNIDQLVRQRIESLRRNLVQDALGLHQECGHVGRRQPALPGKVAPERGCGRPAIIRVLRVTFLFAALADAKERCI